MQHGDGEGRSLSRRGVTVAVVAVAVLALGMRLFRLGRRVAHWDEARVGFDVLRYVATGTWQYRPIVHGPFLPQVNYYLFSAVGADDFVARLPVAVVGGLLPLVALLFRERLGDVETVALAGLLAVDPVLLYYSRFMRNDVPVAAFSLAAFGFAVRFLDSRRRRHLHAAALALALAFTTKENAVLYLVAVGGAALLVLDHRLFLERDRAAATALGYLRRGVRGGIRLRRSVVAAALEFLVVVVFFYAPRNREVVGVGLWRAFGEPATFPAVVEAATVGAASDLVGTWVTGTRQDHAYLPFLEHYATTLALASGGLVALAFVGFAADRYAGDRPRALVAIGTYWGVASVLGYPLVVDIRAPWTVVHAVVPLALPAAAGAGRFHAWTAEAVAGNHRGAAAAVVAVGLLVAGQLVGVAVATSYVGPQSPENPLVQYAQPEGDLKPTLALVEERSRAHDGVDLVWYGEYFYVAYEELTYRPPVPEKTWYNRLPVPWYLNAYDADVRSVRRQSALGDVVASERPPFIVARATDRAAVEATVDGYRAREFYLRQRDVRIVVFVRT